MRLTSLAVVVSLVLGCERSPAAPSDAAAPADRALAPDAPAADAPAGPVDTGLVAVAPYDAGEAPSCTREAVFRRVATRAEGVRDISVGGLVPYRGGFVVAVHESAPRLTLDAGTARRDTIGVLAVDHDAQVQRPLELVYASAATQTDLTVPALIPLGEGALVTFGESRGTVGAAGSVLRLRGAVLDSGAAPGVPAALLEDHGEGAATTLPDGRALLLTSRVRSVSDGGVIVVSPSTYRVDVQGRVNPGQDITASVRLDSESLLLRAAPDGAVLFSRIGNDLQQLAFDRDGSVDLRGVRRTANFGARRLDDAAVLGDVSVLAWGDTVDGMSVVRAAVVNRDGGVIAQRELDRFMGPEPIVAVAAAFGGAAVVWLRGAGDTITLRATTMQPDGLLRNAARDLVRAPRAGGRLHLVVGEGARVATFAAQDADANGVQGVSLGRSCLP
jgi:hypothetical protein